MEIYFKTRKLEKAFAQATLEKRYGSQRARKIKIRLKELSAAQSLMDFWPPKSPPARCHSLSGDLEGMFAVDLDHPFRLIFEPADLPVPLLPAGGADWSKIFSIVLIAVEDYHG